MADLWGMQCLWDGVRELQQGVNCVADRVLALQSGADAIDDEIASMKAELGLIGQCLFREFCGPSRCICRSPGGWHLPHLGPCTVTREFTVDVFRLIELEVGRVVRLNGGAESDEASLIGWSLLVREVLKYSRQVMMKVYVADRTRCEAQLRAWTAPSRKSYDFIGMACCLCELELTYDLPRGRTMQKKPYICTSPYSVTFEEHLRTQHWRRGCQCSSCGKILLGDGGGRGHIIQKQKRDGRHEGAVLIPLTASWICMQRRGPFCQLSWAGVVLS